MARVPLPGFEGMKPHSRTCALCGETRPTVRITAIVGETAEAPGVISHIHACQSCLADSLERLTGYRVKALLERWQSMRGQGSPETSQADVSA